MASRSYTWPVGEPLLLPGLVKPKAI